MEEKTPESAVDIIYQIPHLIAELKNEVLALKSKNSMLEQKLNMSLAHILELSKKVSDLTFNQNFSSEVLSKTRKEDQDNGESEVMDIVTPASPKKTKNSEVAPFTFKKAEAASLEPPTSKNPYKSTEPMPLELKNKKEPKVEDQQFIPSSIKIPYENIDLDKSLTPESKQTSVILKGKFKERDGITPAGVEVKVYNNQSVCVKKTKTASTGEWLAMLPAGDYTIEFSKIGMKPLLKTITVIQGRKEMEILV